MARSINRVELFGNVGADPELGSTSRGKKVLTLSIATTDKWKDDRGKDQEHTEWHRVVFWEGHAETVNKYVRKGNRLLVDGRLRTRTYDDKDGVTRYTTEIHASSFTLIDWNDDEKPTAKRGGRK